MRTGSLGRDSSGQEGPGIQNTKAGIALGWELTYPSFEVRDHEEAAEDFAGGKQKSLFSEWYIAPSPLFFCKVGEVIGGE